MNRTSHEPPMEVNSFSSFKSLSKGISLFVFGVGSLVLLGWALDVPALKSILPGFASMKSNTALLFVLSAISLWVQVKGQKSRIAQICAVIVFSVGLLTLGEYLFNSNPGIDQLLFRDTTVGALYPGRMAPSSALVFLLIGSALMFLDKQLSTAINEFLVIAAFAISMLALIGYIYGVSSLYQIGAYSSMAFHTAVSFLLLSVGILFARPERGLMQTILADTLGGNILRRFLPTAIVLPILLGWIRLWGQRAGLYDTAFGLALMVISLITTLTIFILLNAKQLTNIDFKHKQAEEALKESEVKFAVAFHSSPVAVVITTLDGKFIETNQAFCKLIGYSNEEIIGNTATDLGLLSERDRERLVAVLKGTNGSVSNFEIQFRIRDGSLRDILYSLTNISFRGEVHRLSTGVDISKRKRAEEEILKLNAELETKVAGRTAELAEANKKLQELSIVDELTGLYNRRGFLLHARQQLELARRTKRNLLVFYADLDNLKQINDSFGHTAGDEAIVMAAQALRETFRTSDIKARIGGDEFIVLAVETSGQYAQVLLARLKENLAGTNQTMSVGFVAFDPQDETSIDDLIARADEAMYAEKRSKVARIELGHSAGKKITN